MLWDQQLGLLCLGPWQQRGDNPPEGWGTPFSRGGQVALMLFDCPSKQEKGPELCSSSRGKWGCPGVLGWMERALHPKPGTLPPVLGLCTPNQGSAA